MGRKGDVGGVGSGKMDRKDSILAPSKQLDPSLTALFSSSSPVVKPKLLGLQTAQLARNDKAEESSSGSELAAQPSLDAFEPQAARTSKGSSGKRKHLEEDIEDVYLRKLAREEERQESARKRSKLDKNPSPEQVESSSVSSSDNDEEGSQKHVESTAMDVPQHETLASDVRDSEVEKASRTVFLGNVSNACIKSKSSRRQLMQHLASIFDDPPSSEVPSRIESIRFRSTAFSSASLPKKAAYAKKELMDATTQSTNAYVVYPTSLAAREAVRRLNGTIVLDRHLRVDGVAHPAKVDNKRCVFVGNLGFVDDESNIRATEADENSRRPKKSKDGADVEEGLWRQFSKAGDVESVRVVRDKNTRVGKGIAYVQFKDGNAVEKALLFDGKKFPPLLPRTLRVTRAKSITKTASAFNKDRGARTAKDQIYVPKTSSQTQSLVGRAGKLLGKAGAAKLRTESRKGHAIHKTPEDVVFEGHRARASQGNSTIFGKAKKRGKPTTRSSRRGAAFKASKSKKARV